MTVRPQILNPNHTLSQYTPGQNLINQIDNNAQNYMPQAQGPPQQINQINNNQNSNFNGMNNNYDPQAPNLNQNPNNINANYPNYPSGENQDYQNQNQNQYLDQNNINLNPNPNLINNQNQLIQDPLNPLNQLNIPSNPILIKNAINNPNSLVGGILDNVANMADDRKKKNNDEYKKLLLEQIERKKCN